MKGRRSAEVSTACRSGEGAPTLVLDESTRCPVSQTTGRPVGSITLKALLTGNALRRLEGRMYRFCPEPHCEVVYFSSEAGPIFRKRDLRVRVGQKESEDPVPLCYCFDVALADLRNDLLTSGGTDIPEKIAREIEAERCACEIRNPQGSCCLGNIRGALRQLNATS